MKNQNRKWARWLTCGACAVVLVTLCAIALADVPVDKEHFPDPVFRQDILDTYENVKDGILTDDERNDVLQIVFYESEVKSLQGIAYFSNIIGISCSHSQLTGLDVSRNNKLETMSIFDNKMTSLILGNQPNLRKLTCYDNALTRLDLSGCSALSNLYCSNNQLKTLSLGSNTALSSLTCRDNPLTSLDLSQNTRLTSLNCGYSNIKTLDLSQNTALKELYCFRAPITQLNVSGCTKLNALNASNTLLTELDISSCSALCELVRTTNYTGTKTRTWGKTGETPYLSIPAMTRLIAGDTVIEPGAATAAVTEITLSKTQETLTITEEQPSPTLRLEATVTPTNADILFVTWSSSNTAVAAVDENGEVTGMQPGTALITCEARDGSGVQATCAVTVKNGRAVSVTKVTLSKAKATLNRTGTQPKPTLQLRASVTPETATNKAVTWTSSNAKVAKVDGNGKVTALRKGTAVITCTAQDGSGKSAACTITVKDAQVTKITLSKKKATLKVKETLQLKVKKFSPASPLNQKVKWSSSDKKVATVDKKGKVTAKKTGQCVITCTAQDGSRKSASCKITVK